NITNFGSIFAPLGNVSGGGGGGNGTNGTGNINVTIGESLSITLIDNLVDFGTGYVTSGYVYADIDSNSTDTGNWTSTANGADGWPSNTDYMTLENNGNVDANVNISAGSTAATFIGGTNPAQWYAAKNNETGSCEGTLQSTYTSLLTTQTVLCTDLQTESTNDAIDIMFKLRIPSDATPTAKSNTITFTAVQA
ncbi:MAG: hypothetical protein QW063_02655, partial [Candidatus Nanoarchaeia archaeon]